MDKCCGFYPFKPNILNFTDNQINAYKQKKAITDMQSDDVFIGVPMASIELKHIDLQTKSERLASLHENIDEGVHEKKELLEELDKKFEKLDELLKRLFDDLNNESMKGMIRNQFGDRFGVDELETQLGIK